MHQLQRSVALSGGPQTEGRRCRVDYAALRFTNPPNPTSLAVRSSEAGGIGTTCTFAEEVRSKCPAGNTNTHLVRVRRVRENHDRGGPSKRRRELERGQQYVDGPGYPSHPPEKSTACGADAVMNGWADCSSTTIARPPEAGPFCSGALTPKPRVPRGYSPIRLGDLYQQLIY